MFHSVPVSQTDDTWTVNAHASVLKARKRERNRRQREEYRQVSLARKAAGLTQHVVHGRRETAQNGWMALAPQVAKITFAEVNGTPVVVRTKYLRIGLGWVATQVSLPYLSFLDGT